MFASYLGRAQGLGNASHVGLAIGLAVAASIAQLSEVRTANNKAYVATISFFMAGTLLLPPIDAAGVVAVVFITELIVKSKKLYIAIFNIGSQVVCTLAAYIAYKFVARQRFLRELRISRITVDELKEKIDSGEELVIVDLRHSMDFEADPETIEYAEAAERTPGRG